MQNLMETLKRYLGEVLDQLQALIVRIEESPLFERLLLRYEGLEVRQQKWVQSGSVLGALLALSLVFLIPLFTVFSQKSRLEDMRKLISSMRAFNSDYLVVHRPAPRPQGWQPLPIGSLEEVESSLSQYLASIGIPQDQSRLDRKGDGYALGLQGVSIRQVTALLFQVDGWYPALKFSHLKVSISPTAKDTLDVDAELRFDPSAASKFGEGGGEMNNAGLPDLGGVHGASPGEGLPPATSGLNNQPGFAPGPALNPDDFPGGGGGDIPPPPPFDDEL